MHRTLKKALEIQGKTILLDLQLRAFYSIQERILIQLPKKITPEDVADKVREVALSQLSKQSVITANVACIGLEIAKESSALKNAFNTLMNEWIKATDILIVEWHKEQNKIKASPEAINKLMALGTEKNEDRKLSIAGELLLSAQEMALRSVTPIWYKGFYTQTDQHKEIYPSSEFSSKEILMALSPLWTDKRLLSTALNIKADTPFITQLSKIAKDISDDLQIKYDNLKKTSIFDKSLSSTKATSDMFKEITESINAQPDVIKKIEFKIYADAFKLALNKWLIDIYKKIRYYYMQKHGDDSRINDPKKLFKLKNEKAIKTAIIDLLSAENSIAHRTTKQKAIKRSEITFNKWLDKYLGIKH